MTPEQIESSLNNFEEIILQKLLSRKWLSGIVFLLIVFILLQVKEELKVQNFRFLNYRNIGDSLELILLMWLASFVMRFARNNFFQIVLTISAFGFFYCFDLNNFTFGNVDYLGYFYFPFFILFSFSYLSLVKKNDTFHWLIYLIISLVYFYLISKTLGNVKELFFFRKPLMFVCFICTHLANTEQYSFLEKIKLVFNPSHLILPVNYPIKEDNQASTRESIQLWTHGSIQLSKAFLFMFLAVYIGQLFDRSMTGVFELGLLIYIKYLLIAPAVAGVVTGLSKIYNVDVVDCSNHLWLAGSPFEFLKRENVHAYSFSIRFFYFNFLKFFRNQVVIIFLYFLLFPIYRDVSIIFLGEGAVERLSRANFFGISYTFWFTLFVLLIITYKIKYFNKSKYGWLSVFLHHLIMVLMFSLVAWVFGHYAV